MDITKSKKRKENKIKQSNKTKKYTEKQTNKQKRKIKHDNRLLIKAFPIKTGPMKIYQSLNIL